MAHLGYDACAKLPSVATGVQVSASAFKEAAAAPCVACLQGKGTRQPFCSVDSKATAPLQRLHCDVMDAGSQMVSCGKRYVATVLDEYTGYSVVRLVASKDEVSQVTRDAIRQLQQQYDGNGKVKALRVDNGGEYINKVVKDWLQGEGIILEPTTPYSPQQNGRAERLNRVLLDRVRAMLADSGLSDMYWPFAVKYANYIRNRSPYAATGKTPFEGMFGKKPDLSNIRVFGCETYVVLPKQQRDSKWSLVGVHGRLLGLHGGGYSVLLDAGKIVCNRDATFLEAPQQRQHEPAAGPTSNNDSPLPLPENGGSLDREPSEQQLGPEGAAPAPKEPGALQPAEAERGGVQYKTELLEEDEDADGAAVGAPERRVSPRVAKGIASNKFGEWIMGSEYDSVLGGVCAAASTSGDVVLPANVREALASPQAEQWRAAMDEEVASLHANGTWQLVEPPKGVRPIPVKWVFAVKYDSSGSIVRFKARLVAKGFLQQQGIDFGETFAPVSRYSTVRTVLARAAAKGWEVGQLDVKTAFLQGQLQEEVYVQQPPGYVDGSGRVCLLAKALYGLKQAPRAWHEHMHNHLCNLGYIASTADPGMYLKPAASPLQFTVLVVYVDDVLVVGPDSTRVCSVKQEVMRVFEARDLGDAKDFVGMHITRDRAQGTITINNPRMITALLSQYGLSKAGPRATPMSPGLVLTRSDGVPVDQAVHPYSALVGSLLYLAVTVRPDIAHAVGVLSKYMSCPTDQHWKAAKGVLRYLAATLEVGITYGLTSGKAADLYGWCDADFASDKDTRRSTTGYVFVVSGGAVSWGSRRQPTVAASTTEAEYMAASSAVKEGLWLRKLGRELGMQYSCVQMYCDSQGALALLQNPVISDRSKHIDVHHHFVRERVARNEVEFE
jgi:hypothetical protein